MRQGRNKPEPNPEFSSAQASWDFFFERFQPFMKGFPEMSRDIRDRDHHGEEKYGTRLRPFNGRNPEVDLYQELLDAIVYATQAYQKADGQNGRNAQFHEMRIRSLIDLAETARLRIDP